MATFNVVKILFFCLVSTCVNVFVCQSFWLHFNTQHAWECSDSYPTVFVPKLVMSLELELNITQAISLFQMLIINDDLSWLTSSTSCGKKKK